MNNSFIIKIKPENYKEIVFHSTGLYKNGIIHSISNEEINELNNIQNLTVNRLNNQIINNLKDNVNDLFPINYIV